MKNLIKTAAIALASGIMCLNAGGAEPGKELLGRIKANQQVVTQEVDSVFTEWKAGLEISFPNAGTNTFWIGDKTLGQWLAENKGASQPGISQETDPIFSDWLRTNEYAKVESDPTVPEWAKVENPPYLTNAIVNITTNGVPVEADGDTVNIQIPEQTPPLYVDSTLTTNGAAADAKTVGNELALRANLTRTTVTFGGEDGAGNYRSFTAKSGSLTMYDSTRTYLLYENFTGNEPGTVSLCKFGGVINKIATAQGSLADYNLEFDVPDREDGGFKGFPAGTFTLTRSSKLEFAAYSSNGNVPAKTSDLANDGTNGVPFATVGDVDSATNTLYETMTNEFVRLADIQDGITFDTMNVTNLTINGSAVSTEGHKHDASDITNLVPVTISSISTNGVAITPDGNRNIDIAVPSPVAVVAPSINAAPGTAADAKSVGDALWSGFTEWVCEPPTYNGRDVEVKPFESQLLQRFWRLQYVSDGGVIESISADRPGEESINELVFEEAGVTATRRIITPTKTSQLTNDGTNGTPFAVATDLNRYLPLSGGNMDDQAEISAFTFSTQPGDFAWNYQLLTGNGFNMVHTNGNQDISINEHGVEFGFYPWDNTSDSYGIGWPTRRGTFALQEDVNDASNNLFRATQMSLLGKIDVTNGMARGSLTVYSKGSGAMLLGGNGSIITTIYNDYISINHSTTEGGTEYRIDGIFHGGTRGETYGFDTTTNGIARLKDVDSATNSLYQAMTNEFVKLSDLESGITFDTISVTNITIDGKAVSTEGHKHDVSDITNLVPVTISTITTNGVAITPDGSRNVEITIPSAGEGNLIESITTNGIPLAINNKVVEIPLQDYVKISDLEGGITFDTISVTNLTINGTNVSVEGHVHSTNDIIDFEFPAIHDLEDDISALKKFWARGEGSNSIVSVQLDYFPIPGWSGTNEAFSAYSYADGVGNMVGLKGYRYTDRGIVSNRLTFVNTPVGWEVGDKVSIINNKKYIDDVTIQSISGKTVIFTTNVSATNIVVENDWDSYTAYVRTKPKYGDVDLGISAHASGTMNKALNLFAYAEGFSNQALGQYSHAEGRNNVAEYASHAEGRETKAKGEYTHTEGYKTTANGYFSHAEGNSTTSNGRNSHAEGLSTSANGFAAHAEGTNTVAVGIASHAEGSNNQANKECSHAEGNLTTADGFGAHSEGGATTAGGAYSHAEGLATYATNSQAHAEGQETVADGQNSHAEGFKTTANGFGSHAEGGQTTAAKDYAHAEGANTQANREFSHAEGNTTVADGQCSHSEGNQTKAIGYGTHAEGGATKALNNYAHAEGTKTHARGNYAHAEGLGNTSALAQKVYGTANSKTYYTMANHGLEVNTIVEYNGVYAKVATVPFPTNFTVNVTLDSTKALSNATVNVVKGVAYSEASHVEGNQSIAFGYASHAEGGIAFAGGDYSHVDGLGTIANNQAEHACGKFNQSNADTRFSVGIGTSANARKNGLEVTTDGTVKIIVNGTQQSLQTLLANASSSGIQNITTNGTAFSVSGGTVTIPLDNYVRIDELSKGLKFNNMNVTNLTINGRQPSLVGHTHTVSEIDDLQGLWSIPGAETAATNAIAQIQAAQNDTEVKAALIQFLNNFKKPTQ